eukprot:gene9673-12408_t
MEQLGIDLGDDIKMLTEEDLNDPELMAELDELEQNEESSNPNRTKKANMRPKNSKKSSNDFLTSEPVALINMPDPNFEENLNNVQLTEDDLNDPEYLDELANLNESADGVEPGEDRSFEGSSTSVNPVDSKVALNTDSDINAFSFPLSQEDQIKQLKLKALSLKKSGDLQGAMNILRNIKDLESTAVITEKRVRIIQGISEEFVNNLPAASTPAPALPPRNNVSGLDAESKTSESMNSPSALPSGTQNTKPSSDIDIMEGPNERNTKNVTAEEAIRYALLCRQAGRLEQGVLWLRHSKSIPKESLGRRDNLSQSAVNDGKVALPLPSNNISRVSAS